MGASKFVEDNMDWLEIVEDEDEKSSQPSSTPQLDKWRAEQQENE